MKKNNESLFDFIVESEFYDLADSERWQGFRFMRKDTTAEHSFFVALFGLFICKALELHPEETAKVLKLCLLHDFDEIYTGDVRHPFKYNDFNGDKVRESLHNYSRHRLEGLPDNIYTDILKEIPRLQSNDRLYKICKLCDWMSMYYHLEREMSCGNKTVEKHLKYCLRAIEKLGKDFESLFGIQNKISANINNKLKTDKLWQQD